VLQPWRREGTDASRPPHGEHVPAIRRWKTERPGGAGLRFLEVGEPAWELARALIARPTLLVLDEATSSALDAISERAIQGTLQKLVPECTVVIIAHRLSTIEHADHVVVLDGGRAIEQGSLAGLAGRSSLFQRLYESQPQVTPP
jgi:ABC-type transport system involved in Fe-S cluster assembly fused permease/ATPase subunit